MEDIRMIMKRSCGKGGSHGEKEGGEQRKGGKEEEKLERKKNEKFPTVFVVLRSLHLSPLWRLLSRLLPRSAPIFNGTREWGMEGRLREVKSVRRG